MKQFDKIRREAEMKRQLGIICEAIEDGEITGLAFAEFHDPLVFDVSDDGKDLFCNIMFVMDSGEKQDDFYDNVAVYQPDMDNFHGANGRLTLEFGNGFEIDLIDEDNPNAVNRELDEQLAAQLFKLFPHLPAAEPLTEDETTMLGALDDLERPSDAQVELRHKLKVRQLATE